MSTEIKYTIHFGDKRKFVVNEWLYNYFNKSKKSKKKYDELYKILTGLK